MLKFETATALRMFDSVEKAPPHAKCGSPEACPTDAVHGSISGRAKLLLSAMVFSRIKNVRDNTWTSNAERRTVNGER
jgi:hypothetical protein